jgi:hypothetical protein
MGQRKQIPLPIIGGMNQGADESGLDQLGAETRDAYIDTHGSLSRRDGLVEFCDLLTGAKVDGIYWVNAWNKAIAVSNGKIFRIDASDGTFVDVTNNLLTAGVRVIFTDDGTRVYMANGGKITTLLVGGTSTFMADADAPTTVSHVAFLDQYILANDIGTDDFYFSEPGDGTVWDNEWFSAETDPDFITALAVKDREILVTGPESNEIWINDLESPFSRKDPAYIQEGIVAPYSMVHANGIWFGLSENKEIVVLRGRLTVPIDPGINEVIQGFTTVNDCLADTFKRAGKTFLMFSFPSEERTLVLDLSNGFFYEYGYWNTGLAEYKRYKGNCIAYAKGWNKTLVGDRSSGKIYEMSDSVYSDDGDIIRALRTTGHISHGTMNKKTSHGIRVRVKVTKPVPAVEPNLLVQFNDDGEGVWSTEYSIPLARASNTDFIGYLPGPLGSYNTRQWRFYTTSGNVSFVLGQVLEDVEIMEF